MDDLTSERLKELFSYEAETGRLCRRKSTAGCGRKAGSPIGVDNGAGYLTTVIDGHRYKVHRLVWMYHHGAFPDGFIDHMNGNRSDNRIENLRVVNHRVNIENQRSARADNRFGVLGVTWHQATQMWRARITTAGSQRHLGLFADKEAASNAYLEAKRAIHEGCTV